MAFHFLLCLYFTNKELSQNNKGKNKTVNKMLYKLKDIRSNVT